jgi:GT2 family glycosyltransferase
MDELSSVPDDDPRCSIIVVSWNTKELTLACLESIREHGGSSTETIVVDNGSADGSPAAIAARFPAARLIRSDRNEGFARAVNRGIAVARGRHFMLLNSDARLTAGAVDTLCGYLDDHEQVGIIGAQLINADEQEPAASPVSRSISPQAYRNRADGGSLRHRRVTHDPTKCR